MTARQQHRRDLAATWTSVNPVLLAGEAGLETDTNRIKIGDGSTAWTGLPYAFPRAANPTGGADNYAPIADPTFTGTVTADVLAVTGNTGDLDVDGIVDVESQDIATVPATVRGADGQTASLVVVEAFDGTDRVTVAADGAVTVPTGDLTVGEGVQRVVARAATGRVEARKTDTDSIELRPDNIGGGSPALAMIAAGSILAEITGNGRIKKTGDGTASGSDVMNRDELDARFHRLLNVSGGVGGVQVLTNFSGVQLTIPTGTWIVVWFQLFNAVSFEGFGVTVRSAGLWAPAASGSANQLHALLFRIA